MKKMIFLLLIVLTFISGCAGMLNMREMSVSYSDISGEEILYLLERDLEFEEEYNVSRAEDALIIASDIYKQKEKKGLFGWFGAVWDERIIFTVTYIPESSSVERLNALNEIEIYEYYNGPARVVVETQIYERQNNKFEWQEIVTNDSINNKKGKFLDELRGLIRKYEYSKSKGDTST